MGMHRRVLHIEYAAAVAARSATSRDLARTWLPSYSHWIRIAVSLTLVQFRLALAGWWRWTRIETAW